MRPRRIRRGYSAVCILRDFKELQIDPREPTLGRLTESVAEGWCDVQVAILFEVTSRRAAHRILA